MLGNCTRIDDGIDTGETYTARTLHAPEGMSATDKARGHCDERFEHHDDLAYGLKGLEKALI